jgi:hypothetical protein
MENEIKLPETKAEVPEIKKFIAFEAERLEALSNFIDMMPHRQAVTLKELMGLLYNLEAKTSDIKTVQP